MIYCEFVTVDATLHVEKDRGIYIETKNGKKTVWIFLLQKYSKFSSISLDIFIKRKAWNC